jgi:hypothetical protein
MARRPARDVERAALRAWVEIAKTPTDQPLPESAVAKLREIASIVAALTMSGVKTTRAAQTAAAWAGLTGVAFADFRSEQADLLTFMAVEFNKHSSNRNGAKVEHGIADSVSDRSARQVFRRRARVSLTKNRQ